MDSDFAIPLFALGLTLYGLLLIAIGKWRQGRKQRSAPPQSHHTRPQSPTNSYSPPDSSYDDGKYHDDRPDWAKEADREAREERNTEAWENSLAKKAKDFFFD